MTLDETLLKLSELIPERVSIDWEVSGQKGQGIFCAFSMGEWHVTWEHMPSGRLQDFRDGLSHGILVVALWEEIAARGWTWELEQGTGLAFAGITGGHSAFGDTPAEALGAALLRALEGERGEGPSSDSDASLTPPVPPTRPGG